MDEFTKGVLMSISVMYSLHRNGVECKDLAKNMGVIGADCSELDDFDKDSLRALSIANN